MKNFSLLSLLALATVATGNLTARTKDQHQDRRITAAQGDANKANKAIAVTNAKLAALEAKINSMPAPVDHSSDIAALEATAVNHQLLQAALEAKVQSLQTAVNNMQSSQATASVVATRLPVNKSAPVSSQVSTDGGSD